MERASFDHTLEEPDILFNNNYPMSLRTAVDLDISGSINNSFMDTLTGQRDSEDCYDVQSEQNKELNVTLEKVRANSNSSEFNSIDIVIEKEHSSRPNSPGELEGDVGNTVKLFRYNISVKASSTSKGDVGIDENLAKCNNSLDMCNTNDTEHVEESHRELAIQDQERVVDELAQNEQQTVIDGIIEKEKELTENGTKVTPDIHITMPADGLGTVDKDSNIGINLDQLVESLRESSHTNHLSTEQNNELYLSLDSDNLGFIGHRKLQEGRSGSALSEAIKQESEESKTKEKKVEKEDDTTETVEESDIGKAKHSVDDVSCGGKWSCKSPSNNGHPPSECGTKAPLLRRLSTGDVTSSRKWKFLHPFKNLFEGERSIGI